MSIGNSDSIRTAHNAFARPEVFVSDDEKYSKKGGKSEDVYHFVAFLPFNGAVYELDGLKPGPIKLGEVTGDQWVSVATPAIEERMAKYSANETSFALLSVCEKRETSLKKDMEKLQISLSTCSDESTRNTIGSEIAMMEAELVSEAQNLLKQRQENVRRKHNYLQFTMTLLKALAGKGKMSGLIEAAKTRKANISAARAEKESS